MPIPARKQDPAEIMARTIHAPRGYEHWPHPKCAQCTDMASGVIAALAAAGWAIIPVEPTAAMLGTVDSPDNRLPIGNDEVAGIWTTMLAARPGLLTQPRNQL